jgi:chromosome segregation ATPase
LEEDGRFFSAAALLDDEDARSIQPNDGPLRDELAKAKAAHDQKIDKTLADIAALQSAGKNDDAYQLAVSQAAHASEDVRLVQELATLELAMPSTFERVSTRYKSMDDLLSFEPDLSQQSEFMRLDGIFKKNLDRHLDYQSRIATLESTVDGYNSRIASVRAEIKHNQDKANGYHAMAVLGFLGGIAGAAANSTPGAVGGFGTSMVGANGANAREADIHSLQGEVESLESQRQPSEDQLDALKKEYADFTKMLIGEVQ